MSEMRIPTMNIADRDLFDRNYETDLQNDPPIHPAIPVIGCLTFLFGLWTVYAGCRCISTITDFADLSGALSEECVDALSGAKTALMIDCLFIIYVFGEGYLNAKD